MFKVLLVYPNEELAGVAPSSLAILSACLKQNGIDVKLFDCSMYKDNSGDSQDDIRANLGHVKKTRLSEYVTTKRTDMYIDFQNFVEEYSPNLIGITVVDSTIKMAYSLIRSTKKKYKTIIGGVGALYNYEKILKSGLVDLVCLGEGEGALVDLCMAMIGNEDYSNIDNICTLDYNGNVKKNKKRTLANINNLPIPDYSIYDYSRFYRPFMGEVVRMAQVDFDRGCPFSCSYCIAPTLKVSAKEDGIGCYYRAKSIDKIFDEIKDLISKYDINFLWMSSETFMFMSIKKFRELAERYVVEINLPFWCQSRLDMFTEEKTMLLEKMGCKSISVGLEHGSERIRQEILDKHLSNEKIMESIDVLSKHNLIVTVNNMVGLPDETRENVFETIEMNRKIYAVLKEKQTTNVFTFMPFSGTKLRKICIERGYISDEQDVLFSLQKDSMLTMPSMSKEEIRGLEKTFVLYVTRPKDEWGTIKEAETNDEVFNRIMGIKSGG